MPLSIRVAAAVAAVNKETPLVGPMKSLDTASLAEAVSS